MPKPTIIVHGGAGTIRDETWPEFRYHCWQAAQAGQRILNEGGTALDASIAATIYMEDEVTFNAGYSSAMNINGIVECDALVMTDDLQFGAVAGVTGVPNAVLLARAVMERTPHNLIVGSGAELLADEAGIPRCSNAELVAPRRQQRYDEMLRRGIRFDDDPEKEATDDPTPPQEPDEHSGDTVGACAFDSMGHFAAASSTGGMMLKHPGRAGDVPVVGAGTYVGPAGAVTCTGHGEMAMRVCLAKYAYDLMVAGCDAGDAARRSIVHLVAQVDGRCGVIVIDRAGNRGWATSTKRIGVGAPEKEVEGNAGFLAAER